MPTEYKQGDSRWANEIVGFGKFTMKAAGCTVSCIGYIHNKATGQNLTPHDINERLKAAKAFSGSLILWARIPIAFPELKFVFRDYNYNNFLVWSWININPRFPVLVECVLPNTAGGRHWRVFVGGGKCYNPISGAIESTSKYPTLTGSARYSVK